MKVQTTLRPDYTIYLKNLPFHDIGITIEPCENIPQGTVVLSLPERLVFFIKDSQNRVTTKQWSDTIRLLRCRRLQSGEAFTVTIE